MLASVSATVAVVCFLGILVAIILGIVSRSLLGSSFTWTEELSRQLNVVGTFSGLLWVQSRNGHLAVVLSTPKRTPRWLAGTGWLLGQALVLVILVLMATAALTYAADLRLSTPILGIPLSTVFQIVAVGLFGWAVVVATQTGEAIWHQRVDASTRSST